MSGSPEKPLAAVNDPRRCDFLTCPDRAAIRFYWRNGAESVYCQYHAGIMRSRTSYFKVTDERSLLPDPRNSPNYSIALNPPPVVDPIPTADEVKAQLGITDCPESSR